MAQAPSSSQAACLGAGTDPQVASGDGVVWWPGCLPCSTFYQTPNFSEPLFLYQQAGRILRWCLGFLSPWWTHPAWSSGLWIWWILLLQLGYVIGTLDLKIGRLFHAAAAAKSHQSCLTLCDPKDGSPPGSPVPGILQARILEWFAISFSSARKWKVKVKSLSRPWVFTTDGLQPTRLLCPWDFPGKSTGVGCHCLVRLFPGLDLIEKIL